MTSIKSPDHLFRLNLDDPSVRIIQADNSTDPNASFQKESVGVTGNTVDMVICCLSFVGSLVIILPYILNRSSRKLRHALILGLATSDLVTSVIIIITTACLIANINLIQHQAPCTFLGFVLSTSIFSQHLWNLSIAIVTYMILVHPLSNFTLTVENRVRWLWPVFWIISFAVNAIAFGLGGFGFRGGYCTLTTSYYFSAIFAFIPRAIVFTVILCLYTHLFFFLRRTDLFSKADYSNSLSHSKNRSATAPHTLSKQQQLQSHQAPSGHGGNDQPLLDTSAFNDLSPTPEQGDIAAKEQTSSGSSLAAANSKKSSNSRVTPILNKNDPDVHGRRSLSLVEKDSSLEMKALDSTKRQQQNGAAEDEFASGTAPLATYGMLDPDYSMASRRPVPSQLDINRANMNQYDNSSISPHSPSTTFTTGSGAATLLTKGSSAPLNGSFPRGSGESSQTQRLSPAATKRSFTAEAGSSSKPALAGQDGRRASMGDSRHLISSGEDDSDESDLEDKCRMRPRKDVADFDMITPPVEHLKHYTAPRNNFAGILDILAMGEDEVARVRAGARASERRGSAVQILPGEVVVKMPSKEALEEALGSDWNWGMDVTGNTQAAAHTPRSRHTTANKNTASFNADTGQVTGTSSTSSADEHGVESIGSTLNRQASLLLLLYPAAYCLCFSISIARLSVDLANPAASVRNAHDWLHQLSRWLIFAQGAIDALIFQFIERQFRQRMKRRRRKAMGEMVGDSFAHRVSRRAVEGVRRNLARPSRRDSQQTSKH